MVDGAPRGTRTPDHLVRRKLVNVRNDQNRPNSDARGFGSILAQPSNSRPFTIVTSQLTAKPDLLWQRFLETANNAPLPIQQIYRSLFRCRDWPHTLPISLKRSKLALLLSSRATRNGLSTYVDQDDAVRPFLSSNHIQKELDVTMIRGLSYCRYHMLHASKGIKHRQTSGSLHGPRKGRQLCAFLDYSCNVRIFPDAANRNLDNFFLPEVSIKLAG